MENKKMVTNEWFERHQNLIWKVVSQFSSDPNDMEDLFQDACVAIVKAYPSFNLVRGATETTFLYRCAANAVKMRLREQTAVSRGSRVKTYSLEGLAEQKRRWLAQSPAADAWDCVFCVADIQSNMLRDRVSSVESVAIQNMEIKRMITSIKCMLEPIEFNILWKSYYGYSQDHIAQEVGCSQATVSKYIHTARRKAKVAVLESLSYGGAVLLFSNRNARSNFRCVLA